MADFLGGLLSVVAGAGEGAGEGWQENIKERRKINMVEIVEAAKAKREESLARLRSGLKTTADIEAEGRKLKTTKDIKRK